MMRAQIHPEWAGRPFGAVLAHSVAASPETLSRLVAYNPRARSEGAGRLEQHDETWRIIRVLVLWAIWAAAVILAYCLFF